MLLHDIETQTSDVERVRAAIAHLPPVERDLLVLRFRDGLDLEGLAAATETDTAVVQRRLHHAAWVVEDLAGPLPLQPWEDGPRPLRGRPSHMVEEEAGVGITPLLAARLAAAVEGDLPAADEHWRVRAAMRGLRSHVDGVLVALVVAVVAVPVAVALVAL